MAQNIFSLKSKIPARVRELCVPISRACLSYSLTDLPKKFRKDWCGLSKVIRWIDIQRQANKQTDRGGNNVVLQPGSCPCTAWKVAKSLFKGENMVMQTKITGKWNCSQKQQLKACLLSLIFNVLSEDQSFHKVDTKVTKFSSFKRNAETLTLRELSDRRPHCHECVSHHSSQILGFVLYFNVECHMLSSQK